MRKPLAKVGPRERPIDCFQRIVPKIRPFDLLRSAPDVLASTANFLAGHGWQRGKGWEPGGANFAVIQQWNKSEVYSKTIGYFATQLARAP